VKISVVTISYNQARYLERTILSVLNQRYSELDYIIIDGGSTDGSREIIERYRQRCSYVFCGRDRGPADALNNGFAHATGDLFCFLNSDDVLLPGALARVADVFKGDLGLDFASGHCHVIDGEDKYLRKTYSDRFRAGMLAYDACILLQPATFFRSALFKQCSGFNVANKVSWDAELFLDFGLGAARHMIINDFLASYRVHGESITGLNTNLPEREKTRNRNLQRFLGRPVNQFDKYIRLLLIYIRKILNPRDTWARLAGGPIGGRYSK
jgi:glycosyltransferase involved in cell wall biosynthesis